MSKRILAHLRHRSVTIVATALALLLLGLMTVRGASAAGLLIADGGFGGVLEIEEHDVQVTINNGIAVTHVTQVFRNTENRQVEALYTFPVPKQASVSNFSMWINGREMVGEVLERQRAREIYNSYKRQPRPKDPGLLEQVDYKTFEMRIFPINPGARQKVQVTYYQELDVDHDRVTYVYPLATATRDTIDARTSGRFAFQLEVKSAIPVADLMSPSHGREFVVVEHTDTYALASLEQKAGSLAADIVLNYGLKRPQSGIDLMTSRSQGEDGYFFMTITAGEELARADQGMDYVFLLDISGSMANDGKLAVSRQSLAAFIEALETGDRFELMTFNVQPQTVFGDLRPPDAAALATARTFLDSQAARGGTVLGPALSAAYRYGNPDRPLNVVILSDGMTEQKERAQLVAMIGQRPSYARVFCIGIGNEVNRPLLEQMAEDSGGLAAFISRGDNFKRQAQALRRKLMRPVMADIDLTFSGVQTYDVVPAKLPNLYHGAPVRVFGRYKDAGQGQVEVTGTIQGRPVRKAVSLTFPALDDRNPEIERMWAMKRIDRLLKAVERGQPRQPAIDEIIRLGEAFSIVSEYTSFLVLENDGEYQRWKIERRNQRRIARDRKAQAERQARLQAIRNKAQRDIGPRTSAATPKALPAAKAPSTANPTLAQAPTPSPPPRSQSRNVDFGIGSGPVGPLFLGLAYLVARRRRKQ